MPQTTDWADVQVVGIPRALLFYRFGVLWTTFFESIGRTVVVSEPTDKAIADGGDRLSVDECCLASKVFIGHVESLAGRCDAVFVPCYPTSDHRSGFCTKFQALPDLVANTFADQRIEVLSCLVNEVDEHKSMKDALIELATQRYTGPREAKRAWKAAARAQEQAERAATLRQTRALSQLEAARAAARRRAGFVSRRVTRRETGRVRATANTSRSRNGTRSSREAAMDILSAFSRMSCCIQVRMSAVCMAVTSSGAAAPISANNGASSSQGVGASAQRRLSSGESSASASSQGKLYSRRM